MVTQKKGFVAAACIGAVIALLTPAVWAQDAPAADAPAAPGADATPRDEKLDVLWENLVHYIRLAQDEAARSFGQAVLDFGAKPDEVYDLTVEYPGSATTIARGRNLKGMKEIVDKLLTVIEEGYRIERSDPEQIRKSIDLLGGTQRAYLRGRDRLVTSGEYAVPQLLRTLEDPETSNALREKIMIVLPMLGKEAVLPLAAALQTTDPQLRQIIANALGRIEYPHALPRLKELHDRKDLQPQTRRIVGAALIACAGGDSRILDKPVAQLAYDLAEKFYYVADSLQPDIRSETANVWYWDEDLDGLTYKPVPRQIFCDLYAMRMARMTLDHDAKFYPAVSLWLGANVKREVDLPKGATDPTKEADDPPARFYMLAAGAEYQQDVLARALRDKDWPVAVAAIEALGRTAGAKTLVQPVDGGAQPLVEALNSSNRVVRYWAAVSLASALPKHEFAGHELVMPILSGALRQTGKQAALVVAADQERRNELKDAVRALGYEVVDTDNAAEGLDAVRKLDGVEVAVFSNDPEPMTGVTMVRRDPLLATLPIVITAQTDRFQMLARNDGRIRLTPPKAKPEVVGEAVTELVQATTGQPLSPEEAGQWAQRAAEAIRMLGLTRTPVYDIARTRGVLIEALADERANVKTAAAAALATIPGPEAQRAIADLALDSAIDEKIRVDAFEALDESVRRFGNAIDDRQAQAIVDIVVKGAGPVRMAAAENLGALSLPSEKVKDLILTTKIGQ